MRQEGDAATDCHTCASHFDVARHEGGMSKGGSIESEYDDLIDIIFFERILVLDTTLHTTLDSILATS